MLRQHAIHSVQCCVCHKPFKVFIPEELANIIVEHDIKGHTEDSFVILIRLAFAHTVRKRPRCALLAIRVSSGLLYRFINLFMETDIDECLLIEESLLGVTLQFFGY
jgi:hypothetical protein